MPNEAVPTSPPAAGESPVRAPEAARFMLFELER